MNTPHSANNLDTIQIQTKHLKNLVGGASLIVFSLLSSCGGNDDGPAPTPPPAPQTHIPLSQAITVDGVPSVYAYNPDETETITIKAPDGKKLPPNVNIDISYNGNKIADNYEIHPGNQPYITTIVNLVEVLEQYGNVQGNVQGKDLEKIDITFENGTSSEKTFTIQKPHIKNQNNGSETRTD